MTSPAEPAPLLRVDIAQTHQVRIDRRLALYADGAAWYWSLASTEPETSGRVGTFRIRLDSGDLAQAARLAATLAQLPPQPVTGPREQPQVTVRAGSHAHGYVPGASVDPAVSEACLLAERLMAAGAQSPLSAVELDVRPQPGWPPAGQPGQFAFVFQALGTEAVRFSLDPGSFSLRADNWAYHPQELGGVGLMAAGGRHVDGIYGDARLAPGESAALVLRDLPPFPAPGLVRLGARLEGHIELIGHEAAPSASGHRFLLSRLIDGVIPPA